MFLRILAPSVVQGIRVCPWPFTLSSFFLLFYSSSAYRSAEVGSAAHVPYGNSNRDSLEVSMHSLQNTSTQSSAMVVPSHTINFPAQSYEGSAIHSPRLHHATPPSDVDARYSSLHTVSHSGSFFPYLAQGALQIIATCRMSVRLLIFQVEFRIEIIGLQILYHRGRPQYQDRSAALHHTAAKPLLPDTKATLDTSQNRILLNRSNPRPSMTKFTLVQTIPVMVWHPLTLRRSHHRQFQHPGQRHFILVHISRLPSWSTLSESCHFAGMILSGQLLLKFATSMAAQ